MLGQIADPIRLADAVEKARVEYITQRRQRSAMADTTPVTLSERMYAIRQRLCDAPLFQQFGTESVSRSSGGAGAAAAAVAPEKPTTGLLASAGLDAKEYQWKEHFAEFGQGISAFRSDKDRELIMKGVPPSLRSRVWLLYSHADNDRYGHENEYGEPG